jgi:hypothetical protein
MAGSKALSRCIKPSICTFLWALGALCLTGADLLVAEPYIAFREGLKCSACHVNHTGGGMRNDYGSLYTQTALFPLLEDLSDQSMEFSTALGSSISMGVDFMVVNNSEFSVDESLETEDGATRFQRGATNSFGVESGNLYLKAALIPERLTMYFDETITPSGASSREAFVLVEALPGGTYLKVGRMLLPYGIRLWDDDAFIRRVTGFNYDNQDLGAEVGVESGNLSLIAAVTNGTQGSRDDNKGKQFSSTGSVYLGNLILGGSFSWNRSGGIERTAMGPYGSLRIGPLTLMGETDWINESDGADREQFVAYGSLEYWYRQSINVRLAVDYDDPYGDIDEDERSRVSLGLDAFLTPTLTAGVYYRIKESVPQDVEGNSNTLTFALHTFF